MPFGGNPNSSIFGTNPFKTTSTPFMPTDTSGTRFSGLNAPQAGARPLNSDLRRSARPAGSGGGLQDTISDLIGQIPSGALPYVPPSTAPQIQHFQQTAEALHAMSQPLLGGLLADLANRFGMAQQAFGPEMALRQEMLGLLEGRDNQLLQDLIAMQKQIEAARQNLRPRSGGFFFKGF